MTIEHDEQLEATLEALIFVSKEPLSHERMVEILAAAEIEVDIYRVKRVMKSLIAKWNDAARPIGRGMRLHEVAHGYQFASADSESFAIKKMVVEKPLELTKAQIEVLSIAAYRQPITRVDIDEIRGVDSAFAVKRLMQLKLLKILGKSEGLGRPLLYGTTKRFLEFFALNSLNDLPTLKQIETLESDKDEIVEHEQVSIKDLFDEGNMFSDGVERMSDEALKSLDDAMLHIDNVVKTVVE